MNELLNPTATVLNTHREWYGCIEIYNHTQLHSSMHLEIVTQYRIINTKVRLIASLYQFSIIPLPLLNSINKEVKRAKVQMGSIQPKGTAR